MKSKIPNILDPGVNQFPFWTPLKVQVPSLIPGQQMTGEIKDIGINKIPSETDYNKSDVRQIPFPTAPGQDVSGAQALLFKPIPQGRGAGVGLMDMLQTSIAQTQAQGQGGENGS